MPGPEGQEKLLDPLKLELKTEVRHHVGTAKSSRRAASALDR